MFFESWHISQLSGLNYLMVIPIFYLLTWLIFYVYANKIYFDPN